MDVELSDTAPVVGGQRFYQYAANWVVDNVWASGAWDGIFLDVWGDRIWNSAASTWDVNRDGADETGAALYGTGSSWERGITGAEQIMRARMGSGAILVANNTRTFRTQQLDGRDWESFADPGKGRTFAGDLPNYVAGVLDPGHKQPGVQLALDKDFTGTGTATDRQRARYFMTAALLSNGYWGGSVGDYGGFGWYEEMDGAGLGRGYLGEPVAAAPTWAQISAAYSTSAGVGRYASGVYRRDFAERHLAGEPPARPRPSPSRRCSRASRARRRRTPAVRSRRSRSPRRTASSCSAAPRRRPRRPRPRPPRRRPRRPPRPRRPRRSRSRRAR